MKQRRNLIYDNPVTYLGLGNDFWGCYHCNTHNQRDESKCWICNNAKGTKPPNHWSIDSRWLT